MSSSSNLPTAEGAGVLIRRAHPGDAAAISALLEATSAEHVLPGLAPAGQAYYRAQITPAEIAAKLALHEVFRFHVALDGNEVVGVAATRGGSHLHYLFTATRHHRRGIARALWRRICATARATGHDRRFTVNAAPGAVAAYLRLGFEVEGPSEEVRGIRFVPMSCHVPAQEPENALPTA